MIISRTKIYQTSLLIVSLLFLLLLNEQCTQTHTINQLNSDIASLGIENQSFVTEVNKSKEKLSYQAQIVISQKQAIENGVLELKRIKKLKSKVSFETRTIIDTVFVPFKEVLEVVVDGKKENRFRFKYDEPNGWFSINGYTNKEGIRIDNFTVKNDYSIYIADTKLSLFKKTNPEVLLVNKNPYTETIKMNNIVVKFNKPFYKKNLFWLGVGVAGGILIAK